MTREEILEKSRKENKGADLVELQVATLAGRIAGSAALLLGAIINVIYTIWFDQHCTIFWVMFFGYNAAQGIVMGLLYLRHERKAKGWGYLAYGIVFALMTVYAIYLSLRDMGVV